MSALEAGQAIERFFAEHSGVTMKLPSGWIGRPFDFSCRLTEVHSTPDYTAITLYGPIVIVLTGQVAAIESQVEGCDALTLSGFKAVFWGSLEGGPVDDSSRLFTEGTVEFIATIRG